MKRIIFLIVASLMVLGLVLPGCTGGGGGGPYTPVRELKTPGTLKIGVTGAMGYDQGLHARYGADLAAATIGTFAVGNQSLSVTIVPVETDEILNPGGAGGTAAVAAAVSNVDFMVGGFRTEGVVVYREPAMSANMTFIDCGAATESLCHSVVTNYARYKWFFKGTPYNDELIAVFQGKILTMALLTVKNYFLTLNATTWGGNLVYGYKAKIAVVAEDAEWTRTGREGALAKFQAANYSVGQGLWLVNPLATDITTTLNQIKSADPLTDVIYTICSGPVGMTLAKQVGGVLPNVLVIGTNVEAQRQEFGTEATYANGMIFTDGWAPNVSITNTTLAFLTAFGAAHGGKWPIYTAGTYDAVYTLVEAMQSEAYVEGSTVKYIPEDIVSYMEGSTRQGVAARKNGVYPLWDGVTTGTYYAYPGKVVAGLPALNQSQVLSLYPWLSSAKFSNGVVISNWTYTADNWTMTPHTSHDLLFGTEWSCGIGSQWQWNGTALVKACIWPSTAMTYGSALYGVNDLATWLYVLGLGSVNASTLYGLQAAGLWDQYGWFNFKYPGAGTANLTNYIAWIATWVS